MGWIALLVAFVLGLSACNSFGTVRPSQAPASPGAGPPIAVVTTFSILADIARVVGGDRVIVANLVGPGQDTHTFQPSPSDAGALARADLTIEHGLGFDVWLEKLFVASGSRARRIVATAGIEPFRPEHRTDGAAQKVDEHDAEVDPHVWHDPRLVGQIALTIAEALSARDPANAATYRERANRYVTELNQLDAWIVTRVETVPPSRRALVTNHDSLGYFARRYGFRVVATVLGGVSTEASEPSAAAVAEVIRDIRSAAVPAIFAENVSNPRILARVAQEAGVRVAPPLYTDALDAPGGRADTYVKMMRYNVDVIVEALAAP
ncbi:MAG: metal ABC transporter substrate-binding protein [Chloroflexota bacterium]|nr:MAG: metal ABC transporter substrate-binding protein [Chloroflexota bacterium]